MCVDVNSSNGLLVASNNSIDSCTSYVLVSASEYNNFLSAVVDLSSGDITQLILLGFGLVLAGYLLAQPVGIVINFIKSL
ncbi:hypothetical protein PLEI_2942 [Photobacterium leiognathi lrivu.4.1]|uniref:Uncharacterized protein n=2 Tax=Photobacterium leiognathi TaxID=553611 RepID=V5F7L0_PHOLE|nr:hypothetical protein PLEI_2942 [Photobacterium leiognathi lrivu.4.1]